MAQPLRFVSAACLATIAACQSPPDSTAVPVTETFRDFGEYVMHFNAQALESSARRASVAGSGP